MLTEESSYEMTGTHLYIFMVVSPMVTHFFCHLRTLSMACITRLMSSFARLRVSALTDLDIIFGPVSIQVRGEEQSKIFQNLIFANTIFLTSSSPTQNRVREVGPFT